MRYLTDLGRDLGSLKQYFPSPSNVLDQIKKLPYKAKESLGNIENKRIRGIPVGEIAISDSLFLGSGFSYWYLLREGLHLSTGVPDIDAPIGFLIAGAVSYPYLNHLLKKWGLVPRGQTKLEEFK